MDSLQERINALAWSLQRATTCDAKVYEIWGKFLEKEFYDWNYLRSSSGLSPKIELAKKGDLEAFCKVQFLIDFHLKAISRVLRNLFYSDQPSLRKRFDSLGKEKDGYHSRGYLREIIEDRDKLNARIILLKELFAGIMFAAKNLYFQVFDENENRYDWYYSLALSESEIDAYFQREGMPEGFIETKS